MKIRAKILLAFAAPVLVTLLTTVMLLIALHQSDHRNERVRHSGEVIATANQMIRDAIDAQSGLRGYVIMGSETYLTPYRAGNAGFDSTALHLRDLVPDNPSQVSRIDQMAGLHRQWVEEVATPVISARRNGGFAASQKVIVPGTARMLIDRLKDIGNTFIDTEQTLLRQRTAAGHAAEGRARLLALLGFSAVILIKVLVGTMFSGRLAERTREITTAARTLANGDGTIRVRVHGRDELSDMGAAFNEMADRLTAAARAERESTEALQTAVRDYSAFAAKVAEGDLTTVLTVNGSQQLKVLSENLNEMTSGLAELSSEVRSGAERLGLSTSDILAAVSQHTATANEQSAAISETTSTVEEVRAASEQTAKRAGEVADAARASADVSERGIEAVEAIGQAMDEISDRVEAIARDILALSEQGQQIGEIIATVNDLADQSNILALNAGIEAAKAGEHGKGFAVVATEVRNLAEQSKQATSQVRAILGDIQQATSGAVLAIEQGSKVVDEGQALATRAGETIRSQATTIRDAAHAAQQIAASAHQQSVGMDQVAAAMQELTESTTQFVAGARQSQQAAEDLSRLAGQLTSVTDRYRV
jgi:methyl-accepting chemotaxis protein